MQFGIGDRDNQSSSEEHSSASGINHVQQLDHTVSKEGR